MKKLQYGLLAICLSASAMLAQDKFDETEQVRTKAAKEIVLQKAVSPETTNSVNAATTVATYDFTTGSDKYHGGTAAAIEVETGVWAMIAGDANGDGSINAVDFNDHWLLQNGTVYDYTKTSDFNLDGSINAVDFNEFWLKNNGTATQVPN